jgi:predicted transcriptional regulator
MREAIQQYVTREEARNGFLQEALASWAEYQSTGQHLTSEEAQDWLDKWETDAEAQAPACHE